MVRITVGKLEIHGLVELVHKSFLRILEFVRDFWSDCSGSDCNVTDWPYREVDFIEKVKNDADHLNQARRLDKKFLKKPISTEFSTNWDYEIFTFKHISNGVSEKEIETQIYYDDSLWTAVKRIPLPKKLVRFEDNNGLIYTVNEKSWRIRQNFGTFVKFTQNNAIPIFNSYKELVQSMPNSEYRRSNDHKCNAKCMKFIVQSARAKESRKFVDNIPWEVPMKKFGFSRKVLVLNPGDEDKKEQIVVYTAPCGKEIRDELELSKFLNDTETSLDDISFINFTFNPRDKIDKVVLSTAPGKEVENCEDIAMGRENIQIPVYSQKDVRPPKLIYPRTNYKFATYVPEVEFKKFRSCCTCTDGCKPDTCACMQLTFEGYKKTQQFSEKCNYIRKKLNDKEITQAEHDALCEKEAYTVGYRHGRLKTGKTRVESAMVSTGLFECHDGCSCHEKFCSNRVVQFGMKVPLIIYRTDFCGWGVRAATNIAPGTYLCDYFGELLYENTPLEQAEENLYESDTVAMLNYIEIAESSKKKPAIVQSIQEKMSLFEKEFRDNYDPVFEERFSPTRALLHAHHGPVIPHDNKFAKKMHAHQLETVVPIYDASKIGNLGRFFNHSCNPNLGIQNVFIDHHDLRFPRVSFFTLKNIKAGEEICWDYGYKTNHGIQCHCGAKNCKGVYK